ncbi:DUF3679 domain-containing protein [Aureibacillus halotolerans]|uniref:Uncharacterized protein DUF3679 n=1 Tax=Aureibacillus halotolerans TaxID=1508390 RepID=A0A4R6U4U3_9BACI|nr:DUF3679 domain-containing protein [Aureibacillus halotolerans]TDQ38044.1 uncharacterized protein DUF3679 [Aureibacillus halotolerans]
MKRFFLKTIGLLLLLFISVLYGMQLSNDGMNTIKGYDDSSFHEALAWTESDKEWNAVVLGEKWDQERLEQKQEQFEAMQTENFLSSVGAKTGEVFYQTVNRLLRLVTGT